MLFDPLVVPQACLTKAGYYCGDDDMRWWQFGSTTMDALKTFQVGGGVWWWWGGGRGVCVSCHHSLCCLLSQ